MAVPTSFIQPEVVQGTTTSWLPVTTAYPSVSGCADAFFLFPGQPAPVGWDPGYGYWAGGSLRCLPPAETKWWEQDHEQPDGYTSLSIRPIVCPEAFTTAATEVQDSSSTLVACCPSGYNLLGGQAGRVDGGCSTTVTPGQEISYTYSGAGGWNTTTLLITATTSLRAIKLLGYNVADPTSLPTGDSTDQPAVVTVTAPTSPIVSNTSSGLSTGAKAGIGIGAGFGALALVGLLYFLFVRRRSQHSAAGVKVEASDYSQIYEKQAPNMVAHEMQNSQKYEMMDHRPVELDPSTHPQHSP